MDTGPDEELDRVDTNGGQGPAADGTADIWAYLTTATPYDRNTAQQLRRVGAAWAVSSRDSSRRRRPCRGLATATTRPLQGDTPPSSRRLGALLS